MPEGEGSKPTPAEVTGNRKAAAREGRRIFTNSGTAITQAPEAQPTNFDKLRRKAEIRAKRPHKPIR